jgi:hypothetical protein
MRRSAHDEPRGRDITYHRGPLNLSDKHQSQERGKDENKIRQDHASHESYFKAVGKEVRIR